jgi:hypothetical protein
MMAGLRVHRIVAFLAAVLAVCAPARAAGFVDTGGPSFDAADHVRLNPANPLEAYAEATRGWFHTVNGGASWAPAATPTGTADVIFDPAGPPGRRIALVAGKLLASVDGVAWAPAGAPLPVGGLPHDLTIAAAAPQRRLLLVGAPAVSVVPVPARARGLAKARCRPWSPYPHAVAGRQRLLVTADGGAHWAVGGIGLPATSAIVRATLAADGATAYLVESSAVDAASVWRSGDGGIHWARLGGLATRRGVPVVAADASDPRRVYLAADRHDRCSGQELYRSDDGGGHFVGLASALPASTVADALVTSSARPGRVLLVLHQDTLDAIVFGPLRLARTRRSDDAGATWRNDARGLADGEADGGIALAADGSTWAATGWGVYREAAPDAGYRALAGLPGAATLGIATDLARPGRVFAKTARGVWRSDDGGHAWHLLRETPQRGAALTAAGARNPVLFLTCSICGGVRSLDGGVTWKRLRLPRGTFSLSATPASRRRVFAETTAGWWRSDDAGVHWRAIPPAGIDRLALDPTDARVVWRFDLGRRRISRSLDGGRHWRAVPPPRIGRGGLIVGLVPLGGRRHAVIALVVDSHSTVFPSRALRRDDRTRRWVRVQGVDLRANCSLQVAVDPRRPAQLFLVDTPVVHGTLAPGPARYYVSTNRGATWRALGTSGALGLVVADVTIARGRAYLATQAGVYTRSLSG